MIERGIFRIWDDQQLNSIAISSSVCTDTGCHFVRSRHRVELARRPSHRGSRRQARCGVELKRKPSAGILEWCGPVEYARRTSKFGRHSCVAVTQACIVPTHAGGRIVPADGRGSRSTFARPEDNQSTFARPEDNQSMGLVAKSLVITGAFLVKTAERYRQRYREGRITRFLRH
jgi:hypothetical protein